MAFDFSTLVTDRTMADVLARNAKGTYNAADLNRVDACLEDLVARLGRMGYNVPGYQRVKLPRKTKPSSRLPEGYTQVEYIQSGGAQYINSRIFADNNTRVVLDAQLSTTPTANTSLFGARTAASSKNYAMLFIPSTFRSDYNAAYTQTWAADATVRRIYDKNKETTIIDGLSQSYVNAAFQCDYELFLFAMNQAGGAQWFASGKIFACHIYSSSNLSRDYIPCTNANGAAGLYDLVGQEFYGNAGTGIFTAGEAVTWPEDPEEPAEELDPYTWYESDVPTASQMAQYRGNVAAVRAVLQLPEGTPEPPGAMERLTAAGANSMEAVLLAVDLILRNISAAVRHCGVTVCGSKGVIA